MDMKKQTGDRMKETVLLYGFKDQERLKKVKRALLPLGLRMRTVGPEEYFQPVGYLAGVKEVPPAENDRSGVGRIDYKAVLTPVNQFWDGEKLYEEIAREHEAMTKGGSQ